MRAATLLALMGVSRPIYHLIILNEAILIVLSNHINIMLLPASHVTYTVYNFTDLINNSVCLSVLPDIRQNASSTCKTRSSRKRACRTAEWKVLSPREMLHESHTYNKV